MTTPLVLLLAIALGFTRILLTAMPPSDPGLAFQCFKDAAHLFVGGLLGAWLLSRTSFATRGLGKECRDLAVILSLLELGCFLLGKAFGG